MDDSMPPVLFVIYVLCLFFVWWKTWEIAMHHKKWQGEGWGLVLSLGAFTSPGIAFFLLVALPPILCFAAIVGIGKLIEHGEHSA